MKHIKPATLDRLEPLLREIRKLDALTERSRGVFYRRSKAALHFHEDPAGLFADLRTGEDWERYRVVTKAEQARLLRALRAIDATSSVRP